jgi:hypothetical protein
MLRSTGLTSMVSLTSPRSSGALFFPGAEHLRARISRPFRQADRLPAEPVDERHDLLVDRPPEDHFHDLHRFRGGHPQPFLALRRDRQPGKHAVDLGAAPVHDDRADPDELEQHDVLGEGRHPLLAGHRRPAVLDDHRLPGELPDIRQRLDERFGLLDVPFHSLGPAP